MLSGKDTTMYWKLAMKASERWRTLKEEGLSEEEIKKILYTESSDEGFCLEFEQRKRHGDDAA